MTERAMALGDFFKWPAQKEAPVARKPVPAATARPQQRSVQATPRPSQPAKQRPARNDSIDNFGLQDDDLDATPARAPGMNARSLTPAVRQETAPAAASGRSPIVPRQASARDTDDLFASGVRLVTADGAQFALTTKQQGMLAAYENGIVLIARDDLKTNSVAGAMQVLRSGGFPLREVLLVDLDTIRRGYSIGTGAAAAAQRDTAAMQKLVVQLIKTAAQQSCSDIHITVERYVAKIRVRRDGVMVPLKEFPAATAQDLCQAAFNMADASDANYKQFDFQGARISTLKTPLPEGVQAVRLQFNPLTDSGRYLVMRLLYQQKLDEGNVDVDTLGYSQRQIQQIKRMRDRPYGLIVISGPTGSGKSTTLQRALTATLHERDHKVNVITVEDPPEYEIKGAAQLPVTNAKTDEERHEAFRQAITASLRSDPDIVMIGEIRDEASAGLAFQAAMTGHQVYASLHANDALSILDRLRDVKVENYKLSDHTLVIGLIGQRLVRRLCPECKLPFDVARKHRIISPTLSGIICDRVGEDVARKHVKIAHPKGCPACNNNGRKGRTVVAEVITPDRKFMNFIAEHDKNGAYEHWLANLKGMTMLEHATLKMLQGEMDPRDIGEGVGPMDELVAERVRELVMPQLENPDKIEVNEEEAAALAFTGSHETAPEPEHAEA